MGSFTRITQTQTKPKNAEKTSAPSGTFTRLSTGEIIQPKAVKGQSSVSGGAAASSFPKEPFTPAAGTDAVLRSAANDIWNRANQHGALGTSGLKEAREDRLRQLEEQMDAAKSERAANDAALRLLYGSQRDDAEQKKYELDRQISGMESEISSLRKQLGLTLPQQAVRTATGMFKALPAGLEGFVGSTANACTTLYQGGQGGRDVQNREYLEEYSTGLSQAKRDMEIMLKENRKRPGSWSDSDIESQQNIVNDWQRKYDAMSKVVGEDIERKATRESYKLADEISADSARRLEEAKKGLAFPGRVLVDATGSLVQNVADLGVNTLLGTPGSMGSFGMRAFGGGAQQARQEMEAMGTADQEGAFEKQVIFGLASMAKEIATEKISNVSLPFGAAYGKGTIDDITQNAIDRAVARFAGTSAGKRALERGLNFVNSAAGEGMEELVGDWIEWQLPRIYDGDVDTAQEVLENSLYDFLVGAASGGMGDAAFRGAGSALNAITGNTARNTGAQFRGMGEDVVQATIQEGLASDPSTQSYKLAQQLQQKLDQGQTITDGELGRLYQANVQAIDAEEGGGNLLTRAAEELAEKGRVTNNTALDILENPNARATLETEAGLSITEDMTKSQQRAAVKEAVDRLASRETATQEHTADTETTQRQGVQSAPVTRTERTAAQQAYDMGRMRQAASSLGENGAKSLAAVYDGSMSADGFYAGFAAYYEAGVSGMDMGEVQGWYSGQLNEAQRYAAYTAGQNDAAASLAAEREGVKSATVYGTEAGFIPTEQSANLPRSTVRYYNDMARAVGIKIQISPSTGEGGANGWYANGILHIAQDAENPGLVVAKHEVTHRMQELAPEEYRRYRDYAMNALAERDGSSVSLVEQYKARYAENGINLTTEQAMDEIAADFTEALVVEPQQFERLSRQNRSMARRLLDAVRDFIRKVKSVFKGNKAAQNQAAADAYGMDIDTLEEAARLWGEALEASNRQAYSMTEQEQRVEFSDVDTRYSLRKKDPPQKIRRSLKGSSNIQREIAALQEENRMLRERVDYWRGQTRLTERVTTDQKAVKRAAQELIRSYGANINLEDIQRDLQALYDYIASGSEGENELTYTEARHRAEAIAQVLVENAVAVDDEGYRQYSDLRDYLRAANIVYGTEYHGDIADFGYFRRGLFGKLNLKTKGHTNIDQVYKELSERWPEFFNEQQHTHPTDQLLHIAEVLEGIYNITEYNPFSYHMEEAVAGAANEIMEGFFDLPQTRATFADRQARKLDDAKAKGRQQVQRLREQNNARLEELRQKNRQRVQRVIERERAVRERQLQRLRDHYAEVRQNQAERRADSQARSRLLKIARRLQNKKLPAVNRALLDQYIGDLDTTAKSMTGKTLERLTDLREWYDDRKQNDPDFISDPAIEADLARLSKRHISDLTAEEVADLTRILLNIENELRTERQLIDSEDRRDVYLQGVQVINDVENSGGSREGIRGAFDNYIVTETLSPVRQIKRMAGYVKSDPMIQLVNALADGQRESLAYQMEAEKPFQKWAENKRFRKDFSGADAKSISIAGLSAGKGIVTVEITPAMRAALYLHSLNDQNLRHIRDGGITVPDMRLYRKGKLAEAYARGTTIKLTPSQVRSITAGMTAEERAFARAVHDYFNGQSRERINAVSEKLKGYPIAQVEDYFPINTDSSFTRSDFETLKFDGTLEGMGFLKERQTKAANPILLRDVNLVLEQSISQHGKYVGLAIPVRNFNKVWGVTKSSFNDDGSRNSYESSVQKAVMNTWGESGYNYVEKLMTDLQSGKNAKNIWIRLLNRVRSNYAGAVLTLNMSVAMKQAASYPTAAAVLGWGPLARAMGDVGKVDLDLIAKYTPLQWYRSKGFSTKELGDLRQTNGQIAKVMNNLPAALNWVQGVDLLTTRKLWKASEYYVRANHKGMAVGTDAYYKAVADVYNRVIEETQPNYTTMQRPQLLRSDDSLLGNLAMFKTQPFQNFNILYDAIGEYRAARKNGADIQTARTNLNRAVTSQLAQLAVFAGMTMAWAMFRGKREKYEDEDGEMTVLSVLKALGKDMAGGHLSSVPFGSDAWELLSSKLFGDQYYGMDAVTITALADTVNSLNGMGGLLNDILGRVSRGEDVDWNTARIKMDGYLDDISKVAGVPYENVANLFNASYRHICIATLGKYQGEYAALKLTADPEKKASTYYDLLYQAMVSNRSEYQAIYQDMVESGSFEADKIKSAMESRMKSAQGVENVSDLEQRFLSPAQEQTYSGLQQQVSGTNIWSAATEQQRSAAEEDIYDLIVGNSAGEKLQEKIDGGAAYGIDEADYILYRLALHIVDQPTESGKLGSYTGEEVEAAIEMLPGLSDTARSYLWEAQGKSEKSNPYK